MEEDNQQGDDSPKQTNSAGSPQGFGGQKGQKMAHSSNDSTYLGFVPQSSSGNANMRTRSSYNMAENKFQEEDEDDLKSAVDLFGHTKGKIFDLSPVGSDESLRKSLINIYWWVSVTLMAGWLSNLFGSYVLQNILPEQIVFAIAVIVLPLTTLMLLHPDQPMKNEQFEPIFLILVSLYMLFAGILLYDRLEKFDSPPTLLFPLSIACAACHLGSDFGKIQRIALLAASLGPGVAAYVLLAFLTRMLGFSCLVWLLVMTPIATIDMQLKLARSLENQLDTRFEQLHSVILLTTVDLALSHLLVDYTV